MNKRQIIPILVVGVLFLGASVTNVYAQEFDGDITTTEETVLQDTEQDESYSIQDKNTKDLDDDIIVDPDPTPVDPPVEPPVDPEPVEPPVDPAPVEPPTGPEVVDPTPTPDNNEVAYDPAPGYYYNYSGPVLPHTGSELNVVIIAISSIAAILLLVVARKRYA